MVSTSSPTQCIRIRFGRIAGGATCSALLFLTTACSPPAPAGAESTVELAITNARLIDGLGGPARDGVTLLIDGERIHDVVQNYAGTPAAAATIDAAGMTVMPGLSELHVHSTVEFWTDVRSGGYPDPSVAITSDEDMAEFRRERLPDRLQSFLDTGVTTIVDPGGFFPFVVEIRDQVASGELAGPRMFVTGRLFTAPGVVLLFGTDFQGVGTPADPRELILSEIKVLKAAGLSNAEVIEMITGNARFHPMTPEDIGTIEAGKLADIIIVDADPLTEIEAMTWPTVVVKGGQILVDKRG